MLIHLPRFWFAFILGLVCMVPKGDAQVFHGPHHQPYQDQHFNLNSTRRTDFGTLSGNSAGYAGGSTSTMDGSVRSETKPSGGSTCSGNGNCPSSRNAILRLRIPDGLGVEINGQTTRAQSLGGIHKNSRIFSLEELVKDRVSPCDIAVDCFDEFGNATRMVHTLAVQAGGHYEVRFPNGFEQIDVQHDSQVFPYEEADLGTMPVVNPPNPGTPQDAPKNSSTQANNTNFQTVTPTERVTARPVLEPSVENNEPLLPRAPNAPPIAGPE